MNEKEIGKALLEQRDKRCAEKNKRKQAYLDAHIHYIDSELETEIRLLEWILKEYFGYSF